jgi:uncharacterized protein YbcV (DUF1398 family)
MNNKITENEFQKIISRRSNGSVAYAQFLNELSQRGINEYDIDVATGQATYKGMYSEFKTGSQVSLAIADTFNRNKAVEAIANISLPFLDFLKAIAEAEIVFYRVNIAEKKVIYFGTGEEKIEEKLKL